MNSIFNVIILLFLCFSSVIAQVTEKPIFIKHGLITKFYQGTHQLSPKQLLEVCKTNQVAYPEMKKAKTNNDLANVFGGVGGFLIGWPIGQALAGGDANWTLAGIGVLVIGVSIPFSMEFKTHAENAIEIYNNDLDLPSEPQTSLNLHLSGNSLGIRFSF